VHLVIQGRTVGSPKSDLGFAVMNSIPQICMIITVALEVLTASLRGC